MTETIIVIIAAVLVLAAIIRVLHVRFVVVRDDGSEFTDAIAEARADEEYVDAITGTHDFSYERLYRHGDRTAAEMMPTAVLRPLPEEPVLVPALRDESPAVDDYITGRAVQIIRLAEEERTEWHWDTLTGEWQPPTELTQSLDFDNWLRELLEDRQVAA